MKKWCFAFAVLEDYLSKHSKYIHDESTKHVDDITDEGCLCVIKMFSN